MYGKYKMCHQRFDFFQVVAALRSMVTNLVLTLIFILVFGIMMLCSTSNRRYYSVIVLNCLKGALPIFTTIANFGTVRFVVLQYWQYLSQACKPFIEKFN